MFTYQYLIIGSGMTADAAVRGIRTIDPTGSIGMIGEEADPPYNRPPLSKGLWKGSPLESVWRRTPNEALTLHLGHKVLFLNAAACLSVARTSCISAHWQTSSACTN